jgi:hypothetical protein
MSKSGQYRQHAGQCIRASRLARTAGAKHLLTSMAQRWNDLAEQAEKGLPEDQQDELAVQNLLKTG